MKVHLLLLSLIILTLSSCGSKETVDPETSVQNADSEVVQDFPAFNWDTLKGIYSGDFAGNDIRIRINYISNKQVVGYNVHKGLLRNISGHVEQTQDSIILHMQEPGDNEYDGTFKILIDRNTLNMNGTWVPFRHNLSSKAFSLKRLEFDTDYDYDAKITPSNFTMHFPYVGDSLGDFMFYDDGMVVYEYYPTHDEVNRVEQLLEATGSWSLKGSVLTINWQPNSAFPSLQSTFKVGKDEYTNNLIGEGRTLYPNEW